MKTHHRRTLDGVLLLDKPLGFSSNVVLQRVRWLYQAQKAGHTGNLDPHATGLLPVCFGEATKFSQYGLHANKEYRATVILGAISSTGDVEGNIKETHQALPSEEKIRHAIQHFHGEVIQTPPMHSALKYQGRALYEYARRGEVVERALRKVSINRLSLVHQIDERTIVLDILCSKGTYIRTLAEDIGTYLGCGAYLGGLQRTSTACFSLDSAYTLAQIEAKSLEERDQLLLPVDILLEGVEQIKINVDQARCLLQGKKVAWQEKNDPKKEYRLYVIDKASDNKEFIGVGAFDEENHLYPRRMLAKAVAKYLSNIIPTVPCRSSHDLSAGSTKSFRCV